MTQRMRQSITRHRESSRENDTENDKGNETEDTEKVGDRPRSEKTRDASTVVREFICFAIFLFQVSDLHINEASWTSRMQFEKFCDEMQHTVHPELLVVSGDFTDAKILVSRKTTCRSTSFWKREHILIRFSCCGSCYARTVHIWNGAGI